MGLPLLKINAQPVGFMSALSVQQGYDRIPGGSTTLRLGNGAGLMQQTWNKRSTSIRGSGRAPAALFQIDWSAPVTIDCVALLSVQSATHTITLPAARRTDSGPFGFAMLADGRLQKTTVGIAGNTATLGVVPAAIAYVVNYYPVLTCISRGPNQITDATGTAVAWSLEAEEV